MKKAMLAGWQLTDGTLWAVCALVCIGRHGYIRDAALAADKFLYEYNERLKEEKVG